MTIRPTTPFGRRTPSLAHLTTQIQASAFAERADASERVAHKWKLLTALSTAAPSYGLTDRAVAVLKALLSFHPETTLSIDADNPIIVYPSNAAIIERANGMPSSTMRRHLAALIDAGFIARRDSANGKRFVRKVDGDAIEAFGFDLSPLVCRAAEIVERAAQVEEDRAACRLLRSRITRLRRDASGYITLGFDERPDYDWTALCAALAPLARPLPRAADRTTLERVAGDLEALAVEAHAALQIPVEIQKTGANGAQNGHHIQNQEPESLDFEPASQEPGSEVPDSQHKTASSNPTIRFPISTLLAAFPEIQDWTTHDIHSPADFMAAADTIRPMLGVSPHAWEDAVATIGRFDASITLAAILQRGSSIASPGGYLRALTAKAGQGAFSAAPLVIAGLKSRRKPPPPTSQRPLERN